MIVLGLCLMAQQLAELTLQGDAFIIRRDGVVAQVPLESPAPEPFKVTHWSDLQGDLTVTFDRRGLSFDHGGIVAHSHLVTMPRTPKLFSPEEIKRNLQMIETGIRRAEVSALSGYERIGSDLYLLARWDEADGNPWLEALVLFQLDQRPPQAQLVGRLPGFSFGRTLIEDRLFVLDGKLSALTYRPSEWGLAQYDPTTNSTSFRRIGDDALNAHILPQQRRILGVRDTLYGTLIVSLYGLDGSHLGDVVETRGRIALVREAPLLLRIDSSQGASLLHSVTAEQLQIAPGSAVRDTELGLVVWSPAERPMVATLYALDDFEPLATWRREPPR